MLTLLLLLGCSPDDALPPAAPNAERATFEPLATRPAPSAIATTCDVDFTNSAGEHQRTRFAIDRFGLPLWSSTVTDDGETSSRRWTWRWWVPGMLARGYDGDYVTEYSSGRRTSKRGPWGVQYDWQWDSQGRPIEEGHPYDAGEGPNDIVRWSWDEDGRMVERETEYPWGGSKVTHEWSDDGRYLGYDEVSWEDGSSETNLVWTDHDEAGRPLHADIESHFDWDEPGSSTGTEDWTWDEAGRPLEHVVGTTRSGGDEIASREVWDYTPTVDGGTRVDELTSHDGKESSQSWTLDAAGRIVEHVTETATETWTWDADGRLRGATTWHGEIFAWSAGCPDGLWYAPGDWRPTVLPELSELPDPTDSLENGR